MEKMMKNKILFLTFILCSFSIIKPAAVSGAEIKNIYDLIDTGVPKNAAELEKQIVTYPPLIQDKYRTRRFATLEDVVNKPNILEMHTIFKLALLDPQGPKENVLNFIYDNARNKGIDVLNSVDQYGYTMLHEAVMSRKADLVRFLKKFAQDKGVRLDVGRKTNAGESVVARGLGEPLVLQEIIAMPGVDLNERFENDTLLTLAIKLNLVDTIPLIATRENVNMRDRTAIDPNSGRQLGETPLTIAERTNKSSEIIQKLKNLGGVR